MFWGTVPHRNGGLPATHMSCSRLLCGWQSSSPAVYESHNRSGVVCTPEVQETNRRGVVPTPEVHAGGSTVPHRNGGLMRVLLSSPLIHCVPVEVLASTRPSGGGLGNDQRDTQFCLLLDDGSNKGNTTVR